MIPKRRRRYVLNIKIKEGLMMEDKDKDVIKLAQAIMPALVWKSAKNEVCPVNSHRASVAFLCAITAALGGKYPHLSKAFFSSFSSYFTESYAAFEFVCRWIDDANPLDAKFIAAVEYLFEPQDLHYSSFPVSTVFAERWGRVLAGHKYADIDSGAGYVRRSILEHGERSYGQLPPRVQQSIEVCCFGGVVARFRAAVFKSRRLKNKLDEQICQALCRPERWGSGWRLII